MKKSLTLKKTIGWVLAMTGLALAVCTADGSSHEIVTRLAGVAAFAIGAWLAEAYDFQSKGEETQRP